MRKSTIFFSSLMLLTISDLAARELKTPQELASSLGAPTVYYLGPDENIAVIPTKESLGVNFIDYVQMEREVRFMMALAPKDDDRFRRVKTVILDYGTKPADNKAANLPSNPSDPVNSEWYIPLPERYFLTLKFYNCPRGQLANPSFQVSTVIPTHNGIASFEAFKLMLSETFTYLFDHPDEKNILLKL